MTDIDAAGIMREELDILREELDELHERLAVLTDRVISLEGDRDVLLAALETQSELNERSDAWLVVQRNLGSDSLQRWLAASFTPGYSVHRAATGRGFRVLKVRRHGSPHTEEIELP